MLGFTWRAQKLSISPFPFSSPSRRHAGLQGTSHLCPCCDGIRHNAALSSPWDWDTRSVVFEKRLVPPASTQTSPPGLESSLKNLQVNPLIIC